MNETSLTDDIERAVKMGKWDAQSKNAGDPYSPDNISSPFVEFLSVVPRHFQQAVLTAYTIAYVKERSLQ